MTNIKDVDAPLLVNPAGDIDYSHLRGTLPMETVPRLVRQFEDIHDALQAYGSISDGGKIAGQARKSVSQAIATGLGWWLNWTNAFAVAHELERRFRSPDANDGQKDVANEIAMVLIPLLEAFRDPRYFFSEIATKTWPDDFDLETLTSAPLDGPKGLGNTWWKWGYLSFLNPNVAIATMTGDPQRLLIAAARAEGREPWQQRGTCRDRDVIYRRVRKEIGRLQQLGITVGGGAVTRAIENVAREELLVEGAATEPAMTQPRTELLSDRELIQREDEDDLQFERAIDRVRKSWERAARERLELVEFYRPTPGVRSTK